MLNYYFYRHRHRAQRCSAETPVLYEPAVPVKGICVCEVYHTAEASRACVAGVVRATQAAPVPSC